MLQFSITYAGLVSWKINRILCSEQGKKGGGLVVAMLHHHGGAGSPYEARTADAVQFSLPPPPTGPVSFTSIPRPPMQLQPAGTSAAFDELPSAANLHDDEEVLASASASGAGALSGSGGSRWPREETLALIRIRSEMDAAFRSAPLKAPLWEDVARKLAELGYCRSAKKCKEKFENVDKYYKRTKESRAGRQDGKSYRFFSQLEALHSAAHRQHQSPQQQGAAMAMTVQADPRPSGAMAWTMPPGAGLPDLSVSSMSGSESSESQSDDEFDVEDEEVGGGGGKGEGGGCDEEMMALFEGMMRQVAEKQDAMQRVFMETLERWEAERTAREEAWWLKEVARMNREREQLARERAAAASRDAALIAFLQRVGGVQPVQVQLPPPPGAVVASTPTPIPDHDAAATSLHHLVPAPPQTEAGWALVGGESSVSMPSRWPKEEVQALIQLRTEKDGHYYDAGAKGPLWEDIAAGMRRIGYNRSAKRCKEKWENINKYFKKVKESNKRRPEDSKTCPYFHQLDAIYRKKRFAGGGSSVTGSPAAVAAFEQENASQRELEGKSSNDVDKRNNAGKENVQAPPGNGGETAPTATALDDGAKNKKAEGVGRETNVQPLQQELTADETDSDDMEGERAEDDKTLYTAGLQKPHVSGSGASVPAPETSAAATPASSASAAPTGSTFLAVQ